MLCDNHYEHCDSVWTSTDCDSFHNDECPVCHKEIEPHSSTEYTEDGTKTHHHNVKHMDTTTAEVVGDKTVHVNIGGFSVSITKTDEGVVTDIWERGFQGDEPLGTTWCLDTELSETKELEG